MTQNRGNSDRVSGDDESISWFGAFAGGGLAAIMLAMFVCFIWWALYVLSEAPGYNVDPAIVGGMFIVFWVTVTTALWRSR